jgi:iron complex transport system permease protein
MAPWVVVGIVGALACRRVLGLLMLDEQAAAGMGVNLALWKPVLLGLAVILVAGVVPVAGPVAFIGVSAPHIARLLRPAGPGRTIALTAVVGALIVGLADLVARTIALPQEIPIGVLTALIGGPVFLVLVQGRGAALGGRG